MTSNLIDVMAVILDFVKEEYLLLMEYLGSKGLIEDYAKWKKENA